MKLKLKKMMDQPDGEIISLLDAEIGRADACLARAAALTGFLMTFERHGIGDRKYRDKLLRLKDKLSRLTTEWYDSFDEDTHRPQSHLGQ